MASGRYVGEGREGRDGGEIADTGQPPDGKGCVCVCLHVQAFGPSFSDVCGLLFQCTSMCVCICVWVNI